MAGSPTGERPIASMSFTVPASMKIAVGDEISLRFCIADQEATVLSLVVIGVTPKGSTAVEIEAVRPPEWIGRCYEPAHHR